MTNVEFKRTVKIGAKFTVNEEAVREAVGSMKRPDGSEILIVPEMYDTKVHTVKRIDTDDQTFRGDNLYWYCLELVNFI